MVFSTLLGGSGYDEASGIAVDDAGSAYVAGLTRSADFPISPSAAQSSLRGEVDAFVSKLDATGATVLYSTFLGGRGFDQASAIGLDLHRNAYVTGTTDSRDFPMTGRAFQQIAGGDFDSFVARVNADGTAFDYATFLGGSAHEDGFGIAVDENGSAYAVGATSSADYPVTPGAYQTTFGETVSQAFVTKLDAQGTAESSSTFLGGRGDAHVSGPSGADDVSLSTSI